MRFCPECGNAGMRYMGIGDGFGEFGMQCCDVYICESCGYEEADDCMNCDDNDIFNAADEKGNIIHNDNE